MNCGIISDSGPEVRVLEMFGRERKPSKAGALATPWLLVKMDRRENPVKS